MITWYVLKRVRRVGQGISHFCYPFYAISYNVTSLIIYSHFLQGEKYFLALVETWKDITWHSRGNLSCAMLGSMNTRKSFIGRYIGSLIAMIIRRGGAITSSQMRSRMTIILVEMWVHNACVSVYMCISVLVCARVPIWPHWVLLLWFLF